MLYYLTYIDMTHGVLITTSFVTLEESNAYINGAGLNKTQYVLTYGEFIKGDLV